MSQTFAEPTAKIRRRLAIDIFEVTKEYSEFHVFFAWTFDTFLHAFHYIVEFLKRMQCTYDKAIGQLTSTNISNGLTMKNDSKIREGTIVMGPMNFRNMPISPVAPNMACNNPASIRLP